MLLVLDVGNTNVVLGVFDGDRLVADWRVRTARDRTTDEHGVLFVELMKQRGLSPSDVAGFALSTVVPTMIDTLANVARRYFDQEPFVVGLGTDFGIGIRYNPPSDVGSDRLVNAVAMKAKYGGPAVAVDFGTGTTFDAIAENGDYLGGAIAPGIGIATDALFAHAARLYRVEFAAPPHSVGTNTQEALQSGIVFGYAGLVDAIVGRMKAEIGQNARVIATGGLAEVIQPHTKTVELVDQMLTLDGLRLLWERNRA